MVWPLDELPFLRRHDPDQVQRVQPHRLSQPGPLTENGHPSDVIEAKWSALPLSSRQRRSWSNEMCGLAEALAVGLADQLLEIRHQGAGDGPRLEMVPVDSARSPLQSSISASSKPAFSALTFSMPQMMCRPATLAWPGANSAEG